MWMSAKTFGVKAAAFAANLLLMALLAQEDWGLYAFAMSTRSMLDITGRIGVRQVLVQRQAKFRRWATPAFWMTIAFSILAALLLVAVAPLLGRAYSEPDLTGMVWILATTSPLLALGMVPEAKLQSQMRFRGLASVEFLAQVGVLAATIVLALLGFGAYSFVLPLPFMHAFRAAAFWWLSPLRIRMTPQLRRWPFLLKDIGYMLVANVEQRVIQEADYLILGIFHSTSIVGAYAAAYKFSTQSATLVTGAMTQTMMPAFSKLQTDAQRQLRAFLRASQLLVAIFTPICLLQAAISEPLLLLLFREKWAESIPLLQILSIFMLFRSINGPSGALLRSQGRFRTFMIVQSYWALLFVGLVFVAAAWSTATAVAIVVGLIAMVMSVVQTYLGIRPAGGTLADIAAVYRPSIGIGLISFAVAYSSRWLIPDTLADPIRHASEIIIITLLGLGLYAALLRWTAPRIWFDIADQLTSMGPLRKLRPAIFPRSSSPADAS